MRGRNTRTADGPGAVGAYSATGTAGAPFGLTYSGSCAASAASAVQARA